MQPMAARLGVDHQRLQQFITSSTWDYVAVRRNVARGLLPASRWRRWWWMTPGLPRTGSASPCVARQYSGTLGKVGNCQIGVSVHLVNEQASCPADWRLFCLESWDDAKLDDPVAAARARRRRERAGIPDEVRHTEKWRLALEIIGEMTGPSGWGVLDLVTAAGGGRPVAVADAGYGDNTTFRLELADRGWRVRGRGQGRHQRVCRRCGASDADPAWRAGPAAQPRLPPRTADRAHRHPRRLPPLLPARHPRPPRRRPRRNLTKYYRSGRATRSSWPEHRSSPWPACGMVFRCITAGSSQIM